MNRAIESADTGIEDVKKSAQNVKDSAGSAPQQIPSAQTPGQKVWEGARIFAAGAAQGATEVLRSPAAAAKPQGDASDGSDIVDELEDKARETADDASEMAEKAKEQVEGSELKRKA